MSEKIKEIQDYLEQKGITATETTIVDTAIQIATRWGGNWAFVCELREERMNKK